MCIRDRGERPYPDPLPDVNIQLYSLPDTSFIAVSYTHLDVYKRQTAHGYSNFSSGVGFLLTYDSRYIPANAYKGIYLDFRGLMYQKFLGGDNNFYQMCIRDSSGTACHSEIISSSGCY